MRQPPNRRAAIHRIALPVAALALPSLLSGNLASAATALRLTPPQTEGPYYPVDLPQDSDFDLLQHGPLAYGQGQSAWLDGRVVDVAGQPVAAAVVEIWQCDAQGHYRHPRDGDRADPAFQSFGRVGVAADGAFRFRTIRPVVYDGRTPHTAHRTPHTAHPRQSAAGPQHPADHPVVCGR